MGLLQKILDSKDNLKTEEWFYPEDLLDQFNIYEPLEFSDGRLVKKWFESWSCTDTKVGISAYFLDGELICISWKPYRKTNEEFWFTSKEAGDKLQDYFISLTKNKDNTYQLLEELPNLQKLSSEIKHKEFEFSAENK